MPKIARFSNVATMADKIKFALAVLLLVAGVAGFYLFSEQAMIVRVLSTDNPRADLSATHVRVGLWIPPKEAPLETVDQAALRALRQQARTLESQLRQLEMEMAILGGITVPERM